MTWIGIYDDNKDNIFEKLDGSALTFSTWRPGEGPRAHGNEGRDEQCAINYLYPLYDGWQDWSCTDIPFGRYNQYPCYVCSKGSGSVGKYNYNIRVRTVDPRLFFIFLP